MLDSSISYWYAIRSLSSLQESMDNISLCTSHYERVWTVETLVMSSRESPPVSCGGRHWELIGNRSEELAPHIRAASGAICPDLRKD